MNCDCSPFIIENKASLFTEKIVNSRKDHTCCECHEKITKGKKYHRVKGLWEDGFYEFKTCIPCHTIRQEYCHNGYYFGELSKTVRECLGVDL